jgi:hypothetical protein
VVDGDGGVGDDAAGMRRGLLEITLPEMIAGDAPASVASSIGA